MPQRKSTDKLRRIMAYTNPGEPIAMMTPNGGYKTLTYHTMKPMRAWYEYASTHEDELRFMHSIGVDKFAALN